MNTFRPELTPLEAREVPASLPFAPEFVRSYLTDGGSTLVVSGTAAADTVTVTQDDRAGTLTVTGTDGRSFARYPAGGIGTVAAALRGGDDRFEFRTTGDATRARQLRIDLGDGDDTAAVRWADGAKDTARANLTAVVSGGPGSDAIGLRVGQLAPGAAVTVRADGGAGDDALGAQVLAPGRGSVLDVALRGGSGNDTISTYTTGDLPAGGRVGFDLAGDAGDDSVSVNAAGRVAGAFAVRADGGTGNDELALVATDVTGPRNLKATLVGGAGDDQFAALSDARTADVTADGGAGTDAGLLAVGTTARGVEASRAPTPYELTPDPLPTFNPVLPTTTLVRDGRTVEYYSAGTSKPGEPVVVLLTGFGGTIDYWQTVPASLASKSQVVAVNRPGYGKSSVADGDYALAAIEDIRAVVKAAAGGRPVVLVGHSLGGLYANLYARLYPGEVAGVVFVDSTAPEAVTRVDDMGIPFGGLGDPSDPALRLQDPGVRQEIQGAVSLARRVLAAGAFPAVPVVSLRAGPADLLADDPQADTWYEALGALGTPGETRRVSDSGHNVQYNRPDAVVAAVADVRARVGTSADSRFVSGVLADVAQKYGIPGLSAAVVVGDKVVTGAAGVRQVGTTVPVRTGDAFHLGSTTKAMTATLVGVLVEKVVVRWNTTVSQAFPELKGKIRKEYENVTLAQLLSHTGGIVNDADVLANPDAYPGLVEKYATYIGQDPTAARADFLTALLNLAPTNSAGKFHYSNFGYSTAGAMLERLTGQSYESLMQRYVFGPLGMTTPTFTEPGTPQPGTPRPVGTDVDGRPVADDAFFQLNAVPIQNPAGSNLSMSAADWAKFVRAQLGQAVNGVRLLKPETLAFMQTARVTDGYGAGYGLGWYTDIPELEAGLGPVLYHSGQDGPWWGTEAVLHRDTQFATLIMANRVQSGPDGVPYQALTDSAFAEIRHRLEEHFAPKADVRGVLESARTQANLPALAGGTVAAGRTTIGAAGVRATGSTTAVTADDQFHLGSNGKAMTATLAAILVERGFVRWDTTLGQMFPELRGSMDPAYRDVTLEQLLNHRGGFVDENVSADLLARAMTFKGNGSQARRALLGDILATPAGAVGGFSYSNVGYTLAAAVMERATGNAYEWLMRKYIFNPLGMTSAGFGPPGSGRAFDQPVGHDGTGAPVGVGAGADAPPVLSPAGLMHMSMADWSKFLRVHLGERVNGVKLLSDASLAKLHAPDPRPTDAEGRLYGFGWVTVQTDLGPALWHNGSNGFWYSEAVIVPSKGIASFAVANQYSAAAETGVGAAVEGLLARAAG